MSTKTHASNAARARVTVDDYEGRPAADAAIALRRVGLRPALERTFHWGEETQGLVVAQEPAAGNEVPLDSTVLLFVSAPGERGATDTGDQTATPGGPAADQLPDDVTADWPPVQTSRVGSRRRRKPRPHSVTAAQTTPDGNAPVDGQEDHRITGEEHDCAAAWADEDPLLALAERRLADAPGAAGGGMRQLDLPTLRGPLVTLGVAALTFVVTLLVVLLVGHAHALQAAGAFNGTPISGVQTFVDKLRGNLVWLGGTAMGLVIAVVGIMFMAGHSRAHDLAIRTLVGLAILASISGIVA